MATKVRDLGVEGLLEQRNTVGEGGYSTGTSNTPERKVEGICFVLAKSKLGHFVGRASNVLDVSKIFFVSNVFG